jgi:hypothetical protein
MCGKACERRLGSEARSRSTPSHEYGSCWLCKSKMGGGGCDEDFVMGRGVNCWRGV